MAPPLNGRIQTRKAPGGIKGQAQEQIREHQGMKTGITLTTAGAAIAVLLGGCATTPPVHQEKSDSEIKEPIPKPATWNSPSDIATRFMWDEPGHPADGTRVREIMQNGKIQYQLGGTLRVVGGAIIFPNARGSKNVEIAIDDRHGKTACFGLTFFVPCVVESLQDGTLLVDQEGIVARDKTGAYWQSRKVKLDDREAIAFFPRPDNTK